MVLLTVNKRQRVCVLLATQMVRNSLFGEAFSLIVHPDIVGPGMTGREVGDPITSTDCSTTHIRSAVTRVGKLHSTLLEVAEGGISSAVHSTHFRVLSLATVFLSHCREARSLIEYTL